MGNTNRRASHRLITSVPFVLLAGMTLAALVVPSLASDGSRDIGDVLATRLTPPFTSDRLGHWHLLGTDAFGRDLMVRLWVGARVSLFVGVAGSVLSGAAGIALGAVAGWRGGVWDRVITALGDALLAVPRLVLLLVIAALWGPGLGVVIVVLGLTGWMSVMRLVRAEVQSVRLLPFVEGASALGVPPRRVVWRHVLPNALGSALVATTLGVGNAIVLESGLSFLGLGVQPPTASWGNMISGGREWLLVAPWIALVPGIALIGTVVCATLLGERLAEHHAARRARPATEPPTAPSDARAAQRWRAAAPRR
ncbi:ABC transporter permease [Gemmatimonas sp.]|uniref:ABC transporter permease n=1 Tax=Gemmatimonas sp. TaxID=1962908 RepID=UPI0033429C1F